MAWEENCCRARANHLVVKVLGAEMDVGGKHLGPVIIGGAQGRREGGNGRCRHLWSLGCTLRVGKESVAHAPLKKDLLHGRHGLLFFANQKDAKDRESSSPATVFNTNGR